MDETGIYVHCGKGHNATTLWHWKLWSGIGENTSIARELSWFGR